MNFIRTSSIRIPLNCLEEQWCINIVKDLTRTAQDYSDPTITQTTVYFEKRDGHIWIPRFYPIEIAGHKAIDYSNDGEDIDIAFKSPWRNELQIQAHNMMTTETRGVLKLKPGEGKTVISIGAICTLKKKAIIFVHKDSLASQWIERFVEHSTITRDNIGQLTTADCYDVLKKPIVVATVQTLNSMIDRVPDIEQLLLDANFGIAIWDECHTTSGAEKYSRSALYLPCKRVFGLSATPARADQNHDVIHHHLGKIYEPDGISNTMKPKVVMLYFDHHAVSAHKKYIYWGIPDKDGNYKLNYPKFDSSRYLAMLTSKKNDKYIATMKKVVRKIYDAGRTALFISDRIKVLDMCAAAIPNKNDVGFFIPRSGDKRDSDLLKPFVFSTPGSARDGTDRPEFDTLVMANRISNIEQAAGRVCRPKPNKKDPVIFDVVDSGCEELVKSAEYRKTFYKEHGWEVEEKHLQ